MTEEELREYSDLCDYSAKIRELIYEDACPTMIGAMAGDPTECLFFAAEWIRKQKGLDYNKKLFKDTQ